MANAVPNADRSRLMPCVPSPSAISPKHAAATANAVIAVRLPPKRAVNPANPRESQPVMPTTNERTDDERATGGRCWRTSQSVRPPHSCSPPRQGTLAIAGPYQLRGRRTALDTCIQTTDESPQARPRPPRRDRHRWSMAHSRPRPFGIPRLHRRRGRPGRRRWFSWSPLSDDLPAESPRPPTRDALSLALVVCFGICSGQGSSPSTRPRQSKAGKFLSGVALRASDRLDEPAASFRDAFGSREVAALIIDDGLGVGHVLGEPLAMLGRHEHVG